MRLTVGKSFNVYVNGQSVGLAEDVEIELPETGRSFVTPMEIGDRPRPRALRLCQAHAARHRAIRAAGPVRLPGPEREGGAMTDAAKANTDLFMALPADVQILHLNVQEAVAQKLLGLGSLTCTPEAVQEVVDAAFAAQVQTINDCGGIQIEVDRDTKMVTFHVPRIAGWFRPQE